MIIIVEDLRRGPTYWELYSAGRVNPGRVARYMYFTGKYRRSFSKQCKLVLIFTFSMDIKSRYISMYIYIKPHLYERHMTVIRKRL